jgi:hypothetical protein
MTQEQINCCPSLKAALEMRQMIAADIPIVQEHEALPPAPAPTPACLPPPTGSQVTVVDSPSSSQQSTFANADYSPGSSQSASSTSSGTATVTVSSTTSSPVAGQNASPPSIPISALSESSDDDILLNLTDIVRRAKLAREKKKDPKTRVTRIQDSSAGGSKKVTVVDLTSDADLPASKRVKVNDNAPKFVKVLFHIVSRSFLSYLYLLAN